ncbi:hypothetical protein [Piscinibacter sakaiensis]|uniref:hypothetical protein n=1 Tax=Piscinibacter sakaiensis TaxID=1547922 RepID=UPI0012F81C05|nr:hypothetical protein [Piscinibacter sakaiensis]
MISRFHLLRAAAAALAVALGGCASPVEKPFVPVPPSKLELRAEVLDLRAAVWKRTQVLQNNVGVVQHLGDDRFPGGSLPDYIAQQLADLLNGRDARTLGIKTTDIRLSIPGARIDENRAAVISATTGFVAAPMIGLLSTMERNKTASAVLCVSVDGKDYLGNDGRLFALGAEGELRSSLASAIKKLRDNFASGTVTSSPACERGWEGGQARRP